MKNWSLASLFTAFIAFSNPVSAEVSIFACEPEWGSLAEIIGGEEVKVYNATNALQDAHFISARPSLIARVRNTDLIFCNGAELEIAWLPVLIRQSGNPSIQPGKAGNLFAADFVNKLEIPTSIDRSQGDVHPQGNPHIVGNPHNFIPVARELAKRLIELDRSNENTYQTNLNAFEVKWSSSIKNWEEKALPLKGLPIVVQHKTWVYLTDWLGLNVVTTLEPRPGIPPTTSHLKEVLDQMETMGPKFILNAEYENDKPSRWLAQRSDIPEITLPFTVGGNKQAKDIFSLFDNTVNLLIEGIK